MFLKLHNYIYIFDSNCDTEKYYTHINIENKNYHVSTDDFKNFLEYSMIQDIINIKNFSYKELVEQINNYISIINCNNDSTYYAKIIKLLVETYLDNVSKFYKLRNIIKININKIKMKEENYLFLYCFINKFKIVIKKVNLPIDIEYYELKDMIFDFYS
jgi:hypothetical protein